MFKCLSVFLLLFVVTEQYIDPFRHPNCSAVGNGFTDIGGSCYKVIEVYTTFDEARARCAALHPDADLATIRCDVENDGLYRLTTSSNIASDCRAHFKSHGKRHNFWRLHMWIGLIQASSAGHGVWINGADAHYRHWQAGEPNNQGHAESGTEMFILDSSEGERTENWNDVSPDLPLCAAACEVLTAKSGSMCGLEPCPKTATTIPPPNPSCMHYSYPTCDSVGNGFSNVGGSCYRVLEVHANFDDARALCKAQHPDADLATIRCDEENQGIYDLTRGDLLLACESYYLHHQYEPNSYYQSQMWIGLNYPTSASESFWVNGAKAPYRHWSKDPNIFLNQSGTATYMNLFEMDHSRWNTTDPSTVMCAAVCEVITLRSGSSC